MEAVCHNIFKVPEGFEVGTLEHIQTLKIAQCDPVKHESVTTPASHRPPPAPPRPSQLHSASPTLPRSGLCDTSLHTLKCVTAGNLSAQGLFPFVFYHQLMSLDSCQIISWQGLLTSQQEGLMGFQ